MQEVALSVAMPTIALFNDYGALDLYSSDAAVSEPGDLANARTGIFSIDIGGNLWRQT